MNQSKSKNNRSPKVFIIIINWNQEKLTRQCIESLKRIDYTMYEIVMIDNHSTDGSYEALHKRYGGEVTIIRNDRNYGFCEGNNIGIRYALKKHCDYVCLLNNDTIVEPDFLNHLVQTAETDPSIGMVGGKIFHFEPKQKLWQMGAKINFKTSKISFFEDFFPLKKKNQNIIEVDYIPGCLMLVRVSLIKKIGMLEPLFFNFFEDADWCMRTWENGYRVVVNQKAIIYHKVSAAIGPKWKRYMLFRNQPLFMALRKNLHFYYLLYYPWWLTKECIMFILTNQFKGCFVSFMGFFDFLTGNFLKGRIEKVRRM